MVKYELQRSKKPIGNFVMVGYDIKIIKKSELEKHLKDGWIFVRKKYFIITHFLDFWRSLNTDQKISIIIFTIGSIITIIIAVIGWIYFIN
jgi:hypothetical protein